VIPKTQHAESLFLQPSVSPIIVGLLLTVLSTVNFYHHPLFQTDKINEVWSDGSLPTKFMSANLAQPKMAPKNSFSVCRIASQVSGSVCNCSQAPILSFPRDGGRKFGVKHISLVTQG
jgi:hypothetical protein